MSSADKYFVRALQSPRTIVLYAGRDQNQNLLLRLVVVVEEADETVFWLEMLVDTNIVAAKKMEDLLKEANELLAIFAASQRTAKRQ